MGNIILKNAVKRRKGYIYYIDRKGNLCCASLLGEVKKKEEIAWEKIIVWVYGLIASACLIAMILDFLGVI